MPAHVDLSDDGQQIFVRFRFSREILDKVSNMPGAKFKAIGKEPHPEEAFWRFPANVDIARSLHDGLDPEMTKRFKKWAREILAEHRELSSLSMGNTAELEHLPFLNEELYEQIHLGPRGRFMDAAEKKRALAGPASFQAADVAFFSKVRGAINANHPGTGKTHEVIGTSYESQMTHLPHLVSAPISSLDSVWLDHLVRLQENPILVAPPGRGPRIKMMQQAMLMHEYDEPFWLVVNPAMLQYDSDFERCEDHINNHKIKKHELRKCGLCKEYFFPSFAEFEEIEWGMFVMDEFHMAGIGEPSTMTHKGAEHITAEKILLTSGTPIGGKVIKLYGALNILDPKEFSSKWRFADMWLSVTENDAGYKNIGGIRSEKQSAFYAMLSTRMVRRTKAEVLPWLPPKDRIDLEVPMTPKQEAQY